MTKQMRGLRSKLHYVSVLVCWCAGVLVCAGVASAQWNKLGEMEGGQVQWLDYRDGVVMAGMYYGGLALSYDHGSNWEMIPGTKDAVVTSACVHGDTILAGFRGRGFGVTTDRGKNWRVYQYPLIGNTTSSAHIIRGNMFMVSTGTLYRSADAGFTWNVVIDKLQTEVFAIGDRLLFVRSNLLQFSDDLGDQWEITNTPTLFGDNPTLQNLVVVRDTAFLADQIYIFMSTDSGLSWSEYRKLPYRGFRVICRSPYGISYADSWVVHTTTDGFRSIALDTVGLMVRYPYRIACLTDSVALIGTDQGIWGKRWSESKWRPMNRGLYGVQVNMLKEFKGQLVAAAQQGLYRSSDKGSSWTHVEPDRYYQPHTCLWVWNDTMYTGGKEVLRSTDGVSWMQSPDTLMRAFDHAVATDSLVFGFRYGRLFVFRGTWPAELVPDFNSGSPYTALTVRDSRFVFSNGRVLWVGDDINQPEQLRKGPFNKQTVKSLALTPAGTLIISGWTKVMASYDNFNTAIVVVDEANANAREQNWGVINVDLPGRGSYQVLSKDEAILLSRNDGRNWSDISAGGPENHILRFEQIGSTIYALTDGDGIWTMDLLKIVDVEEASYEQENASCITVTTTTDGRHLATCSHDGRLMISNLLGQLVRTLDPVVPQQQILLPMLDRGVHHLTCSVCKASKKL